MTSFICWSIFCLSFIHLFMRWGEIDLIFGADRAHNSFKWKTHGQKRLGALSHRMAAHFLWYFTIRQTDSDVRTMIYYCVCSQWIRTCVCARAVCALGLKCWQMTSHQWQIKRPTHSIYFLTICALCNWPSRAWTGEAIEYANSILLCTFASSGIIIMEYRLQTDVGDCTHHWAPSIMISSSNQFIWAANIFQFPYQKRINSMCFGSLDGIPFMFPHIADAVDNVHYSTFCTRILIFAVSFVRSSNFLLSLSFIVSIIIIYPWDCPI